MSNGFWRAMTTRHWADEVRPFPGIAPGVRAGARRPPVAEGETLIEIPGLDALDIYREAWSDLSKRALEPNPFLEPEFAQSAILHSPAAQRPEMVFVWQGAGFNPRGRLIGAVALESGGSRLIGVGRNWRHRHGALGTPLIDRFAGARAIDSLFGWLRRRRPRPSALMLESLVRDGPVYDLLTDRCVANGLPFISVGSHERAALLRGQTGAEVFARARSAKHRRELDRLRRRLAERGGVAFGQASTPAEVRDAVEWFMALEYRGWKGGRGTAFLSDGGDSAFLRSTTRLLAAAGRCRIYWLAIDGAPIAMGVMLMSGDRAYYWKTAYDEDYGHFSPGVQLTREIIDRQLADDDIVLTDSCAIADHPMIDRVWPDRQPMVELLIGLDPARSGALPLIAKRERFRRQVRAIVKTAANKALGRKAS
jgi:CelD/BcsL family acetyltransferase involved in cellulose biosynthesis